MNPLSFQLDNKNWGHIAYNGTDYFTSDLGTIYREFSVDSYILLMEFNGHSVDVGKLLNEMLYKGRKLGEI